jgi:hypothetical protein
MIGVRREAKLGERPQNETTDDIKTEGQGALGL